MNVQRVVPVFDIDYPEGPLADALEAEVERKLPPLPGLTQAATQDERLAIYAAAIEAQRADFVDMYGCPFGWEKRSEPRDAATTAPAARQLTIARVN